jgi:Rrf2 family protein
LIFKKSTRYALYAAMELARASPGGQVTVTHVAARYAIPVAVLAKVLQQLVRSGIAVGTRGVRGGYSLVKKPSELTVLDVIEAFEPSRRPEQCLLREEQEGLCEERTLCRLRKLCDEVEQLARCTYASVTLETLVGNRPRQGLALRVVK